ncbi:MAG: fimbrillin family protein [Tidjanibacter sp.]|nr:fimbrillin family protein [Tidjanibacter sp.]
MKKFSTIAILALMFVGCNNNFDTVEPTVKGTPMTIVATTADEAAEGRTALNTADGKTVVWKTDDKLGVFCEYNGAAVGSGYQNEFTLASGDGSASGEFSGTIAGLDDVETNVEGKYLRYHAYYPMTAENAAKKKFALVGTLEAEQSYDVTAVYNDMSANDVMIGKYLTGTKEETTIPLTFEHVFAMMNFEISSAEALTVNRVEMIAPEGVFLSGPYTLQANKDLVQGTNPTFASGNVSVGVNVANGQIAAGGKITARLIFNRWAATNGQELTVKVYTDKGTQVITKTAADFSGKNNWGLRLALDTETMEPVIVDNYVEGMHQLGTGQYTNYLTDAGTYCVMEGGYTCSKTTYQNKTNEDITIIGRYTENGVPQQTANMTITPNSNTDSNVGNNNFVIKDLIWIGTMSGESQVFRMSKAQADVNSVTIENCIIDGQNLEKIVLIFCNDSGTIGTYGAKCVKNIVVRNCKFINIANNLIASFAQDSAANIESFTFENNVIETTRAQTTVESFFSYNEGHSITVSYAGSTVVNTEAATLSLKWATEEI